MRKVAVAASIVCAIALGAPSALAANPEPAEQSPVGGPGAHQHSVTTGSGECQDVGAVKFEPAGRGLHRGANESGEHGPTHGGC